MLLMSSMLCRKDAENRCPCYHHTYAKSFSLCGFTHSVYLPRTYFTRYIYMKPFPETTCTISVEARSLQRHTLAKTHAKAMPVLHTQTKKKKTQTVLITPYVSFQSLHLSPKQSSLPLGDRERRLQHLQFIQYLSLSVSNRANQSHLLQQGLQGMLYKEQTLCPGLPAAT